MDTKNYTKSEKDFICFAINRFGDGEHPCASPETLKYFEEDYVTVCVERAIDCENLTLEGFSIGINLRHKI